MGAAAGLLEPVNQSAERRHARQLARGDGGIDPRQVLHHQAAGAEIGVADLGIAHLAIGQADKMLACFETAMRPALGQPPPTGRLARAIALSAPSSRSPHPSRMHSTKGPGRGKVIIVRPFAAWIYLYTRNRGAWAPREEVARRANEARQRSRVCGGSWDQRATIGNRAGGPSLSKRITALIRLRSLSMAAISSSELGCSRARLFARAKQSSARSATSTISCGNGGPPSSHGSPARRVLGFCAAQRCQTSRP